MPNKKPTWQQTSSKVVHSNPWYQVRKDAVITPAGKRGNYFVVDNHGTAVTVLAQEQSGKLFLINQYRYPSQRFSWEFPAGSSEKESLLQAAKRELWEETGLKTASWQRLGYYFPANGFSSAKCVVYLASKLTASGSDQRADEGISELQAFTEAEIEAMIRDHRITDGLTISAFCLYKLSRTT